MKIRLPRIPFLSQLVPLQGSILYSDDNRIVLLLGKHFEMVAAVLPSAEDAERVVKTLSKVNPSMMDNYEFCQWLYEAQVSELEEFGSQH